MPDLPGVAMCDHFHDSKTPCPCSKHALPKLPRHYPSPTKLYESTGTLFQLQPCRYNAKELVWWTSQRWEGSILERHSVLYRQWIVAVVGPMYCPSLIVPFDFWAWKDTDKCHDFVRQMFHALDICFFFGTMSRRYGNRKHPLVNLVIDRKIGEPKKGEMPRLGYEEMLEVGERAQITICPRPDKHTTQSFASIFETLVHEMIHAYLDLFSCREDDCMRKIDKIHGITGHSGLFMVLQALTTMTIQSWSPKLKEYKSDSAIDMDSLRREIEAMDERDPKDSDCSDDEDSEPFIPEEFSRLPGFQNEYARIMQSVEIYRAAIRKSGGNRGKEPPQVWKGPKVSGTNPVPYNGTPASSDGSVDEPASADSKTKAGEPPKRKRSGDTEQSAPASKRAKADSPTS